VYLKDEISDHLLERVEGILTALSTSIERTRKRREWALWIAVEGVRDDRPFHVHVWNTEERLWECEDDLEALGVGASELPTCIEISAGCNRREDREALARVLDAIAGPLGGVATNPEN
jgi:hypothetical protein